MDNFYLTDYSVQSLTLAMLSFVISLYLVSLKNKDISNWMLLFFFFFFGVFSIRGAFQNSSLEYDVLPFNEMGMVFLFISLFFMTPFSLYFHRKSGKKARRAILTMSILTLLFVVVSFVYMALKNPWTTFQFASDQFFFKNVGRVVGIPSSIFVILPAVIFFVKTAQFSERNDSTWKKIFLPRGRYSKACSSFAWMMLLQIVIASFGIVAYLGIVPFPVIKILMLVSTLVLFFFISILYFNTAPQMSTFMVKIVGISLLTIMVFCSGLGSFLIHNERERYDEINLDDVKIVKTIVQKSATNSVSIQHSMEKVRYLLSSRIMYVAQRNRKDGFFSSNYRVVFSNSKNVTDEHLNESDMILRDEELKARLPKCLKDWNSHKRALEASDEKKAKAECLEDLQRTDIPLFVRRGRLWDYKDPSTFYHLYNFVNGDKIYEVGFNYPEYRKQLSGFSSILLISQLALSLVIILLFPLFFRRVITNPLGELLLGVRKVNEGDLRVKVPDKINDEIGFIGRSFNKMVSSIAKAQSELENYSDNLKQMVDERTTELKSTMKELEVSNAAVVRARDELWGEMQLAKKIQTHLVPDNPVLLGYEISTYIAPADDVGGDYFDILNYAGRDWIVIGDVSGHGVSAGLIMMMVQTAIHVVLENLPKISPAGLLKAVNASITENIKRFKEDKYMTITVLSCHENGTFHFSGLHQDIILYRAKEDCVQTVETDGIWIGVTENIDGLVHDECLTLQKNDTMLLFTDGMIEAVTTKLDSELNGNAEMYGHERLTSLLKENGKESTERIKGNILESLEPFNLTDDVTFVIIKRQK